jgi:drug/metabolite transporter (DMT)-like permease
MAGPDARPDRTTLFAFGWLIILVGTNPVAIRFSNRELDPFWGGGVRFVAAALLFAVLMRLRGLALPRGRALAGAVLYGAVGIGAFFAFAYWGLVRVNAGLGGVIFATVPLLTFFFAVFHGLEPFRWRALTGALVVVGGVGVVFGDQISADVPLTALLSLLAAAVCAAETNIIVKRLTPSDPVVTNAVAMAVGAVILLAMSAISNERYVVPTRGATWAALVYLATVGTLGVFMLFLFVLKRWQASSVAYEFVLAPFVATALGAWLLDESVTLLAVVGAVLVLAGVYVGALSHSERRPVDAMPAGSGPETEPRIEADPASLSGRGELRCSPP